MTVPIATPTPLSYSKSPNPFPPQTTIPQLQTDPTDGDDWLLHQPQSTRPQPNGGTAAAPTVVIVKELSANRCFTQSHLRRIYVQPRTVVESSTAERSGPQATSTASVATFVVAGAQADCMQNYARPSSTRLPALVESPAHSGGGSTERTVSCRLYDCILPSTCASRNASSGGGSQATTSVLKLDLPPQQQQQLWPQRHGNNQRANSSIGNNAVGSSIFARSQQSKRTFLLDAATMDRSVDSIGSCSLDVDAESTDFSGTSRSSCTHNKNTANT